MRERMAAAMVLTVLVVGAGGCGKAVDKGPLLAALNKAYDGRHVCVWPDATKLPATIDPTKDDKIRGYEALTDAGLLTRVYQEKKEASGFIKVNKYDLTDKGHAAWVADPKQEGWGNFCFGHFNVTAIDKATPDDSSNPTRYTVNYSYEVEGIPGWARTPESMRAFRGVAADTSIQSATATLVKDEAGGWRVEPAP
ncbi:hypothetical protein DYQ86_11030 [Acidobacteria bacterium AB60]|nr:hypothetical protein DYQ86_11030 [Acidobacteria bacterium AB60]